MPRARSLQARAALLLRLLGCPLVLLAACASAPSDKAIAGRAPAGAHGYRVATLREGSQTLRCFPPSASRALAVFRLEPFETPVVPMRGRYVVLYFDELGNLIGEPTFTVYIGWRDRDLRLSDGDRTLLPRRRDERRGRIRHEG